MSDTIQKIIAVCIADINEEYNDNFLRAFHSLASEYHYKILYFYSFSPLYTMESHDFGEKNIFQLINYDMIHGLIILSQTIKSMDVVESIVQAANNKKIPVVSVDCPLTSCYNIDFNYDKALEDIISHLIEAHHVQRFNFIAGIKGNVYSEHRLSIFRNALQKHGITLEEERIGYGDFWAGPTNQVMDRFFSSKLPFPEAIVCANDSMAITVFDRLTEAGYRIPEDVIVTGFDGIQEALQHTPPITTAHHDIEGVARAAYQIFDDLFENRQPQKQNWVDSKIILGGSCGCPVHSQVKQNQSIRSLYDKSDSTKIFNTNQIRMIADLTDKHSFQEVFEKIKDYTNEFSSDRIWLCIVDNFLTEEEFSDILEESNFKRNGYSSKMDLMLYRDHNEWQGIMDFETKQLLPNLEGVLKDTSNLLFFPLHVHEQTIGYATLSFDDELPNISHCYQFFMNVSIALEVTKAHRRQQTIIQNLENKYVHDPLTGLFNRRGFYQRVTEIYSHCMQNQQPVMIVSIDLNGLKPINDTFGHADGDTAISTVAKALLSCSRRDDVCARFGGDEFVVAGSLSDESEASDYITQVQEYLKQFNATSGKPYQISASFGLVAAVPNDSVTLDEFIRQADEKMYAEKAKHHLSRSR